MNTERGNFLDLQQIITTSTRKQLKTIPPTTHLCKINILMGLNIIIFKRSEIRQPNGLPIFTNGENCRISGFQRREKSQGIKEREVGRSSSISRKENTKSELDQ